MNKKILIWGTVITVVALGGYFVFKSMSKEEDVIDALGSTELGTTPPTGAGTTPPTGEGTTPPTGAGTTTTTVEPSNFLQQIKRKEAQRILDWVIRSKPSIAETTLKFEKIKKLGYNVVGANLVFIS